MYARFVDEPLDRQLTDEDLERFDWYIVLERAGGIQFRIVTSGRPT